MLIGCTRKKQDVKKGAVCFCVWSVYPSTNLDKFLFFMLPIKLCLYNLPCEMIKKNCFSENQPNMWAIQSYNRPHDCNVAFKALFTFLFRRGHCDRMVPVQSVSITTKAVSSNPAYCEVYAMPNNLIKLVSDLRQVGGFLRILRFPPPIKLSARI